MKYILLILISYIIGNLSPSYIIGKVSGGIDIRNYGSGNAGSTNVLRVLGKKAAFVTFLVDSLKGVITFLVFSYLFNIEIAYICSIVVVIGHNWPIILKFKGGKGVATTIGLAIAISPLIGSLAVMVGLLFLLIFKIVSLGSLMGVISFSILLYFMDHDFFLYSLVLSIMAIFRHKDNLKRLLKGEEKKITKK